MQVKQIGNRGALFIFDELDGMETSVYAINGYKRIFIVDTFLGPEAMAPVKEYIANNFGNKPVVAFNTHYHWDHIWGNCAFPETEIYAHQLCRSEIFEKGVKELTEYGQYQMGKVEIVFPTVTFSDKLLFEEEGIEMFYSPGHTVDSASLYDRKDEVLIVGDNIEAPVPYLMWPDLEGFCRTLEYYKTFKARSIISGHCPYVTPELLDDNLQYLQDYISDDTAKYQQGNFRTVHLQNMKTISRGSILTAKNTKV
jgi:cyclase